MMTIDISPLLLKQQQLDNYIQQEHHLTYQGTRDKRILSLLVELGELANETRCFKFWSLKGPSSDHIIFDEYADGMHFLLSLAIDFQSNIKQYSLTKPTITLTEQFLLIYEHLAKLKSSKAVIHLERAFNEYLNMMLLLKMTPEKMVASYLSKLDINYSRQKNNY